MENRKQHCPQSLKTENRKKAENNRKWKMENKEQKMEIRKQKTGYINMIEEQLIVQHKLDVQ